MLQDLVYSEKLFGRAKKALVETRLPSFDSYLHWECAVLVVGLHLASLTKTTPNRDA